MGFEHLNWLIFLVLAGLTAFAGALAVIRIWGMGLTEHVEDPNWGALHGLYAITAAVVVEACWIVFELLFSASVATGYISGVRVIYVLQLVEYGVIVAIFVGALVAAGRIRSNLGSEVRVAGWTLLVINLVGGALFPASELNA